MPTNMTKDQIGKAFFDLTSKLPKPASKDEREASLVPVAFSIGISRNEFVVLRFTDEKGRLVDLRLNPIVAGALQSSINGICRSVGWYDEDGVVPRSD
jgi:hypothetical protein